MDIKINKETLEQAKAKLKSAKEYAIEKAPEIATVVVGLVGVVVLVQSKRETARNTRILVLVGDQVAGLRDEEWGRWNTLQDRWNRNRMAIARGLDNDESFTHYPGLGVIFHPAEKLEG